MNYLGRGASTIAALGAFLVSIPAMAQPRAAVTSTGGDKVDDGDNKNGSSSIFTIGTLYGVAIPMYKPEFFRVSEGRLERIRDAKAEDYFTPAVYVFPSVALWTYRYTRASMHQDKDTLKKHKTAPNTLNADDYDYSTGGRTLAIILPAGLTTGTVGQTAVSVGVGLSLGWTILRNSEIGFSGAVVWNQTQYLDNAQRRVIDEEIPAGVSDQIATRFRPSLALGLYISPTF